MELGSEKASPKPVFYFDACTCRSIYISWPRLILASILNGRFDNFLTVIGLVCSSWVTVSQGTHCRAPWFPLGREKFEFVRIGNELTSRILDQIQQLCSISSKTLAP